MLCDYWPVADLNFTTSSAGTPPAVFHLDALRLSPLPDLGGIQPAAWCPARAAGRPAGATAGPPPSPYVGRQRVTQLPGMLGVQVDLVLRAVQSEADRALRGAAIQVVDEQGLRLSRDHLVLE